jgi:hypothetical protein
MNTTEPNRFAIPCNRRFPTQSMRYGVAARFEDEPGAGYDRKGYSDTMQAALTHAAQLESAGYVVSILDSRKGYAVWTTERGFING